jgi:hypothetical protein
MGDVPRAGTRPRAVDDAVGAEQREPSPVALLVGPPRPGVVAELEEQVDAARKHSECEDDGGGDGSAGHPEGSGVMEERAEGHRHGRADYYPGRSHAGPDGGALIRTDRTRASCIPPPTL